MIKPYAGNDALACTDFRKSVLSHLQQTYRTGTTSAVRMEVVLADIVQNLTGPLEQWHLRTWKMIIDLHLHLLIDWLAAGKTPQERAVRCRQVLMAVAPEDLVGTDLEIQLRWARTIFYQYEPGCIPIIKDATPLYHANNTLELITEERQLSSIEQARIDTLIKETNPRLHHGFVVPLGTDPSPRYTAGTPSLQPPVLRTLHDREHLEPEFGDEGTSRHNPFALPADPPATAAVPPVGHTSRVTPSFAARFSSWGARPTEANADEEDSHAGSALPAATARTTFTTTTRRQVMTELHPEWAFAYEHCTKAGDCTVTSQFMLNRHAGLLETHSMFDKFMQHYIKRLHNSEVPHIEDTYMELFIWHKLNKPSADLEHQMQVLTPDPLEDKKDLLGGIHAWDVKFTRHYNTIYPWCEHLQPAKMLDVYLLGMRSISQNCFTSVLEKITAIEEDIATPLLQRTARAREVVHQAITTVQKWQEGQSYIKRYQLTDAPSAPKVKDAVVDKRDARRTQVQFKSGAALHTTNQQQPLPSTNSNEYTDESGAVWTRQPSSNTDRRDVYATSATPRPASLPPANPTLAPRTTNAFAPPRNYRQPARTQYAHCTECGTPHGGICFVQYPSKAGSYWHGPPPGEHAVYAKYLDNARKDGMEYAQCRPFTYLDGSTVTAQHWLSNRGNHSSTQPSTAAARPAQDARQQRPPPNRSVNLTNALQHSAHSPDPAADNIRRFAGPAMRAPVYAPTDVHVADLQAFDPFTLQIPADIVHAYYPNQQDLNDYAEYLAIKRANELHERPTEANMIACLPSGADMPTIAWALATTRAQQRAAELAAQGHMPPPEVIMPGSTAAAHLADPSSPVGPPPGLPAPPPYRPPLMRTAPAVVPTPLTSAEPAPPAVPAVAEHIPPSQSASPSSSPSPPVERHNVRAKRVTPRAPRPFPNGRKKAAAAAAAASPAGQAAAAAASAAATQLPSRPTVRPPHISATGRARPPVPYQADPIDPRIPPSQLPNAQRTTRPGYGSNGEQLMPAARLPTHNQPSPPLPRQQQQPRQQQPAFQPSLFPTLRFPTVQLQGPTASLQYMMSRGPQVVDQALAAAGCICFSHNDQLYSLSLDQCILALPDATSQPAGAASVPSLPATPHAQTLQEAVAQQTASLYEARERDAQRLAHMPSANGMPPAVAATPQLPATLFTFSTATQSFPASPAASAASSLPPAAPAASQTPAVPDLTAGSPTYAAAASHTRPPLTPHVTPSATTKQARAPSQALAGRVHDTALVARRDSLENHGILGVCPFVSPICFMPSLEPGQYLHIQEMDTGVPANKWTVAVFDSGADVCLCSERFATENNLPYSTETIAINTANGTVTSTLGELLRPLEFWLGKDTPFACKAVAPVQVMSGVDDLYDLIISVELIMQWCAWVDTSESTLVYRPDWWTKKSKARANRLPIRMTNPMLDAAAALP